MSYSKTLVDTTNALYECIEKGRSPIRGGSPKWLARGLRISCKALSELMMDPEFFAFVQERLPRQIEEGREVLREFERRRDLMDEFLKVEAEILLAAGYPQSLVTRLIGDCQRAIVAGAMPDVPNFVGVFRDLRERVCGWSDRMDYERQDRLIGASVDVCAGFSLAALNGALFAGSFGLSAGWSAASGAAGAILINNGAGEIKRLG